MSPFLFATSGVDTWLWLPPLAAFIVSSFGSMVGISGAFLLMPFQMSLLGHVGPSVSATNLVFNLYATPGGAWRYAREGRMAWPLARRSAGRALHTVRNRLDLLSPPLRKISTPAPRLARSDRSAGVGRLPAINRPQPVPF